MLCCFCCCLCAKIRECQRTSADFRTSLSSGASKAFHSTKDDTRFAGSCWAARFTRWDRRALVAGGELSFQCSEGLAGRVEDG